MSGPDVFPQRQHEADLCVVGGGMAGLTAAVTAARHGAKVVLMHDRPVPGGNASGECRVHICGADRAGGIPHMRETGLLEEIRLDNLRRNPDKVFSIRDTILYEKAMGEENLTLLLNCTCLDATMDAPPADRHAGRIASVTGWQLTTQTYHRVRAKLFADCSGDAILAPLTGAACRIGREGRDEYGESIAPPQPDRKTMGMTCYFQAREHDAPRPFEPLDWACTFNDCDELPRGAVGHEWWRLGYWWVELGGEHDSIADTERLRHELLRIAYGIWDHIKNRCPHAPRARNWALEWVQFLPAKRESRRYLGDHVLTQHDIEAGGRFDDTVAYGGWTMDDHHPAGFYCVRHNAEPTIFHPAPCPYGIPYRSLCSRDVANLLFAGRDASCTHAAMSSTRVQGTGTTMGHAVGTAAAMAAASGADPCDVDVAALQQALLRDDCYLPGIRRQLSELTASAELSCETGDPEPLRDGVNRQVGEDPHCWTHGPGEAVAYRFDGARHVREVTLVLDSAMERDIEMHLTNRPGAERWGPLPDVLPRAFRLEGLTGGRWVPIVVEDDNHQRLVRIPVGRELEGVRYVLDETRGADRTRLQAFYVD
ncbi:MAG: FAD-dependent oxidoreductase [Planctomycetota bacterium]